MTVSIEHLQKSGNICRAIVANAGNANCATPTMNKVARATARGAAKVARVPAKQVLVASTGVIGEPLDEGLILKALPGLHRNLAPDGFEACAAAIMTTDTYPKTAAAEVETRNGVVRIAGMAKGAGMIQPNMATMLSFIFTDAAFEARLLSRMLRTAVERSFNRISVDGDTSTNDTVLLLANGESGVQPKGADRTRVQDALNRVAEELAVGIVGDGEGSKKVLTIDIEGRQQQRRRGPAGEGHCEFAAGQDGARRGRSELGPHHFVGRSVGREVRSGESGHSPQRASDLPARRTGGILGS